MLRLFRSRCSCGGQVRKIDFYLDPYKRWDHYYLCAACGTRSRDRRHSQPTRTARPTWNSAA